MSGLRLLSEESILKEIATIMEKHSHLSSENWRNSMNQSIGCLYIKLLFLYEKNISEIKNYNLTKNPEYKAFLESFKKNFNTNNQYILFDYHNRIDQKFMTVFKFLAEKKIVGNSSLSEIKSNAIIAYFIRLESERLCNNRGKMNNKNITTLERNNEEEKITKVSESSDQDSSENSNLSKKRKLSDKRCEQNNKVFFYSNDGENLSDDEDRQLYPLEENEIPSNVLKYFYHSGHKLQKSQK